MAGIYKTFRSFFRLLLLAPVLMLVACGPRDPVQAQAEAYVRAVLALGQSREQELDAWFGPPALAKGVMARELPVLRDEAAIMLATLRQDTHLADTPRSRRLQEKVTQLMAVLEVLDASPRVSFADEAERLYGITLPEPDASARKAVFDELEALLPGTGTLAFRVAAFRNRLLVPADKRRAVFERALQACHERTLAHWQLPAGEELVLEWTRDVSAPWHRYEGGLRSTLRINDLTLGFIGSALDVACHEGYPGHHAQFVLLEAAAGEEGLPVEDRIVMLRSPASVLREAAAEFGVALAFPQEERLAFERDVLFPLAGLPPELAATNLRVTQLLEALAPQVIPILRDYRDGEQTFNASTFELEREALVSSPAQLLQFTDATGAYAVGYTLVRTRLAHSLMPEGRAGEETWAALQAQLLSPDSLP